METGSFKFHIGDTLQLQHVDGFDRDRKNVRLIGCSEGRSLIVTAPSQEGNLILVREDQHFVVRMFSENTVQAFNARVLKSYQRPYPYFHLSYPDECESHVVRRAHRVDLNKIISIRNTTPDNEGMKLPAKLTNLSTAGAEIVCNQSVGGEGDILEVYLKLSVGGVEKYLSLPAEIKRLKQGEGRDKSDVIHGIQFLPLEDEDIIVLHGFVYETLIKN